MEVNSSLSPPGADSEPRRTLKQVARRLIAERGVRSVSVRQIGEAAGQKNRGVVAYYFGTKENLLSEILIDGAQRIEARRQAYLDAMEAEGGPGTITEAVRAIVLPSAGFSEDEENGKYFNRFLLQLSFSDPELIDRTLEDGWNTGYQRCLRHLRRLMSNRTRSEQSRRFVFLGTYLGALLAQREALLDDPAGTHPSWRADATLEDIIRTAAAILEAPGTS